MTVSSSHSQSWRAQVGLGAQPLLGSSSGRFELAPPSFPADEFEPEPPSGDGSAAAESLRLSLVAAQAARPSATSAGPRTDVNRRAKEEERAGIF